MFLIPVGACLFQRFLDTGMAERHHSHHDTYGVSMTLTRTLLIAMLFMAVLGLALTWLCQIGAFSAEPDVLLAFFSSFVFVTFAIWVVMRRYAVVTYDDHMVVTPFVGARRTICYKNIVRMEWAPPSIVGGRQNVRVYSTDQKHRVTIWGSLDVQQILMRINRFDALESTFGE